MSLILAAAVASGDLSMVAWLLPLLVAFTLIGGAVLGLIRRTEDDEMAALLDPAAVAADDELLDRLGRGDPDGGDVELFVQLLAAWRDDERVVLAAAVVAAARERQP